METDKFSSADSAAEIRIGAPERNWPQRSWRSRGYDVAERLVGGAWFLLLAIVLAHVLMDTIRTIDVDDPGAIDWPKLVSRACVLLFYATLSWLIFIRPRPIQRKRGIFPTVLAFVSTYVVWLLPLLPPAQPNPPLQTVSASLLLVGSLAMIYVIVHLGRSFSIVPQARKLVTSGPYAVVRHPLYLAEEIAILGAALQYAWWASVPFLVVHTTLQIRRMYYEEDLLRSSFPDYADYARHRSRVIPGVW
ncbi:MAG: Isoprenylcysteine carboxyl methyltransferase [Rhodospirillales bacterium]|nr:Isoprenylcysteine carboxyl methyltransferase [Rhodospirillales bacterium]